MTSRTILLALALMLGTTAGAATYDVLELPAEPSNLASKSLIYSIKKFGDR